MKAIDLAGKTFGRWTVKGPSDQKSRQGRMWVVVCECGREAVKSAGYLNSGKSGSCTSCPKRKIKSPEILRQMRERGAELQEIAAKFGVSVFTVQRHVPNNGRYSNWMWKNFDKVKAWRRAGKTWEEILPLVHPHYTTLPSLQDAWGRERRHRLRKKFRLVAEVASMTQRGASAATIAKALNISTRTVIRYRHWSVPVLDLGRIRMLQARGVDWRSIWSRLGRPTEDSQELSVWFELLDADEAEAFGDAA